MGFVSGQVLISIFVSFCILQTPPSHHISSSNVNGSLNNHQEQTNRLSPEGTSSPLLPSPLLFCLSHSPDLPTKTLLHGLPHPPACRSDIDYHIKLILSFPIRAHFTIRLSSKSDKECVEGNILLLCEQILI